MNNEKKPGPAYTPPSSIRSKYSEELNKFIGEQVTVTDHAGNTYSGICRALSDQHLNVVLMTEEEKLVIKNVSCIRRKRNKEK